MSERNSCPKCAANWIGAPIPADIREFYYPPYFFKREVGLYDQGRDITVAYKCPDCQTVFDRWTWKQVNQPDEGANT